MSDLSAIIKERIEQLKFRRNCTTEDMNPDFDDRWFVGYDDACIARYDEEINFLVELLDAIERKVLKEQGYNV